MLVLLASTYAGSVSHLALRFEFAPEFLCMLSSAGSWGRLGDRFKTPGCMFMRALVSFVLSMVNVTVRLLQCSPPAPELRCSPSFSMASWSRNLLGLLALPLGTVNSREGGE